MKKKLYKIVYQRYSCCDETCYYAANSIAEIERDITYKYDVKEIHLLGDIELNITKDDAADVLNTIDDKIIAGL